MWCSVASVRCIRHLVITLMGGHRTIYASIPMDGVFGSFDGGRTVSAGFCLIANRWAVVRFCTSPCYDECER